MENESSSKDKCKKIIYKSPIPRGELICDGKVCGNCESCNEKFCFSHIYSFCLLCEKSMLCEECLKSENKFNTKICGECKKLPNISPSGMRKSLPILISKK